jgi:hypothetical protein
MNIVACLLKARIVKQWHFGSPEAEEDPLLEAVTKQSDWEHWSLCTSGL